jgi:selenocysteine lyase/cysteine desulfurase
MGIENIIGRQTLLLKTLLGILSTVYHLHILGRQKSRQIPVITFFVEKIESTKIVNILSNEYLILCRRKKLKKRTYASFLMKQL